MAGSVAGGAWRERQRSGEAPPRFSKAFLCCAPG
jgi:hypothetical protein